MAEGPSEQLEDVLARVIGEHARVKASIVPPSALGDRPRLMDAVPQELSGTVLVRIPFASRTRDCIAALRVEPTAETAVWAAEYMNDALPFLAFTIESSMSANDCATRSDTTDALLQLTRLSAGEEALDSLARLTLRFACALTAAPRAQLFVAGPTVGDGVHCLLSVNERGVAEPPGDAGAEVAAAVLRSGSPTAVTGLTGLTGGLATPSAAEPGGGAEEVKGEETADALNGLGAPMDCGGERGAAGKAVLVALRPGRPFGPADERALCALASELTEAIVRAVRRQRRAEAARLSAGGTYEARTAGTKSESAADHAAAAAAAEDVSTLPKLGNPSRRGAEAETLLQLFSYAMPVLASAPAASDRGVDLADGLGMPSGRMFWPAMLTWDFDTLSKTDTQLAGAAVEFFYQWGCPERFGVPDTTLRNLVHGMRKSYYRNHYHNFAHVLSVVHFSFMLVQATQLRKLFTPLDKFALLVAAVGHDVDHPGWANDFEVKIQTERALRYNDSSVLESHHAAMTFMLMRTRCPANDYQDCDVFARLTREQALEARRRVIGAILSTDMVRHSDIVKNVEALDPTNPFPEHNEETRQMMAGAVVHAADLSNPLMPSFRLVRLWAVRVCTEFLEQTKREEAAGVPVTSWMCALTNTPSIAKTQSSFGTFVVRPLFVPLARALPETRCLVENLERNKGYWDRIAAGEDADEVTREAEAARRDRE